MSKEMAEAFGDTGECISFAGRPWNLRYLDVNDLITLQRRIGGVEMLDVENMEHLRLFFWLVLRKSDPALTEAQIDAEEYTLTEGAVGRMLSLRVLMDPSTKELINSMMIGSGLAADPSAEPEKNRTAGKSKR